MNKFINWGFASKLAIIFGIVGGIYLLYQFFDFMFSDKMKFETEISIREYEIPINKRKQYYFNESRSIIPSSFDSYSLSRYITDSLEKNIDLSNYSRLTIRKIIKSTIPKEFDQKFLVNKIDSLVLNETYPIRKTDSYISSMIKNNGNKIVKNLRFELPANGYYELLINDKLIAKDNFSNNIYIGELRSDNKVALKIWSFSYIEEYHLTRKDIKYTFENGFIVPTLIDNIKAEGFIYWIYDNTIWAIYFLIFLPVYITAMIVFNWRSGKKTI